MILLDTTVVIDWSQSKDAKLRVLDALSAGGRLRRDSGRVSPWQS